MNDKDNIKKNKGIGYRIASIIYYVIMAFMGCVILINVINRVSYGDSGVTGLFGYTPTIVVSESMVSTIDKNAVCIVKKCGIDSISVGDIIVYADIQSGRNIVHRVISKNNGVEGCYLKTKGDNNQFEDSIDVYDDLVFGKVVVICNWLVPFISRFVHGYTVDYEALFVALVSIMAVCCSSCFLVWFIALKTRNKILNTNKELVNNSNEALN